MNILVIFAHSDVNNSSIANRVIIEQIKEVSSIEVRELYQMYPDFKIDVDAEQQAILDADLIIFQYPLHWYNMPGLLKEWIDRVFLRGFAYGCGNKLNGKSFLVSTTIGGPRDSYKRGGHNNFTLDELLTPLEQTASFTGMKFNKPIISYNMAFIPGGEINKLEIIRKAREHATRLLNFIKEQTLIYSPI
ncbi:NAD(P)H-dependent oxidoreductase [Shewanella sp. VB17]|uniref:NAD(P)H-dependent oxidoreductase n=1 Tax=Shewanella sp. VB17 TaxID=2739432 RepID=UPI00156647DF|nr:NAD(P)H-dependent oxidoreductase [Shewanella sp. VB17]NRD74742.1 NAD(P)H-dependent oxidoreductase [Shewanella sp. VB17]